MRGILEKVPGVESADVDFASKLATVQVKGAAIEEAIQAALDASGQYSGHVVN